MSLPKPRLFMTFRSNLCDVLTIPSFAMVSVQKGEWLRILAGLSDRRGESTISSRDLSRMSRAKGAIYMQIGAMNNPLRDPVKEIERIAREGFEFVDLTIEPPAARSDVIDVSGVKRALRETGLGAIGHTAYYLPIASPFDSLRECAVREIENSFKLCLELGITKVNVHPQWKVVLRGDEWVRDQNIESLRHLADTAEKLGQKMIIENGPGVWSRAEFLEPIFDTLPEIGFHLDVGHANLDGSINRTEELLTTFGYILEHVHFSDNPGGIDFSDDLHLPIGAGRIDWPKTTALLKAVGYDGTITLEIFSRDLDYLYFSRDKLSRLWYD